MAAVASSINAGERSRSFSTDVIRSVAIAAVVLLHANSGQFANLGDNWWISNAINSATRVCVPLFLIISGALLIPRPETYPKTLQRSMKILLLIIVWSYIYIFWIMQTGNAFGYQWDKHLTSLFDPSLPVLMARYPMMAHLHFLYGLFVLYLFLPVLRAAYQGDRYSMLYLSLASFFVSTLATFNSVTNVSWIWLPDIQMFSLYAGYACFGAFFARYKPTQVRPALYLAAYVALTIGTFLLTGSVSRSAPNEIFAAYSSPTVMAAAAFIFLYFRSFDSAPPRVSHGVRWLSSMSLGIYFVHMIIISPISGFVWSNFSGSRVVNVLLTFIITYLMSMFVVFVIRLSRFTRWTTG